jgi:hypothetical protein
MSTPPPPPDDPAGPTPDQQWLARLGGQPGPFTDTQAVREADALREAILAEARTLEADPALQAAISPAGVDALWQRVAAQLGDVGPAAAPSPAPRRPPPGLRDRIRDAFWPRPGAAAAWWQGWPATAGLAAVLVLSTVVVVQLGRERADGDGEWQQLRGDAPLLRRTVAQPQQAAQAYATALRNAGLKPAVYERKGRALVIVTLDATELAAAADAFALIGQAPVPGTTRVEFAAP